MTLQQLKYVTTIANIGSISEAAKRLFVSQPSLTKAIKELEKEMGITIFDRTNKGITVSKEGELLDGGLHPPEGRFAAHHAGEEIGRAHV